MAMVLAVGVSYAIDAVILALLSLGGILGASIPLAYAVTAVVHVGLFGAVHWSGLSERFRDAQMTHWQVLYASAVQLAFMWHAPVISSYFMSVIIIVFAFGSLRIALKQLMLFWLVTCLTVAVVLTDVRAGKSIDHPSEFVVLLIWGSFATVLLRCILIGYFPIRCRISCCVSIPRSIRPKSKVATGPFRPGMPATLDPRRRAPDQDRHTPIAQIGAEPGFDSPTTFHRAFKTWTGSTSGAYR